MNLTRNWQASYCFILTLLVTAPAVLANKVSYWQQEGLSGKWQATLVDDEGSIRGYLKTAGGAGAWVFTQSEEEGEGGRKAVMDWRSRHIPGPWWLFRPYQPEKIENDDVLRFSLNEAGDRLHVFLKGEEIEMERFAEQSLKESEKSTPNLWKGECLASKEDNIPLQMSWYEIRFSDPSFVSLEPMIAEVIEEIRQAFLAWAPERLKDGMRWYFEQSIVPALIECSPKRVTVLIYNIRRAAGSSSDVKVSSASFARRDGGWEPVDLVPRNLSELQPERIPWSEDDPSETVLMQPDLAPCAWLPGRIALWSPLYQDAGSAGVVIGRFVMAEDGDEAEER